MRTLSVPVWCQHWVAPCDHSREDWSQLGCRIFPARLFGRKESLLKRFRFVFFSFFWWWFIWHSFDVATRTTSCSPWLTCSSTNYGVKCYKIRRGSLPPNAGPQDRHGHQSGKFWWAFGGFELQGLFITWQFTTKPIFLGGKHMRKSGETTTSRQLSMWWLNQLNSRQWASTQQSSLGLRLFSQWFLVWCNLLFPYWPSLTTFETSRTQGLAFAVPSNTLSFAAWLLFATQEFFTLDVTLRQQFVCEVVSQLMQFPGCNKVGLRIWRGVFSGPIAE